MELAADTLRQFGKVRFVAHGCSMVPSICPGDLLTICSVAPSRLAPGDVVLTSREGRFYIHRLLRTWREGNQYFLQARGDALRQADPISDADQLLGRVTAIERHGKELQTRMALCKSLLASLGRRSEFMTKSFLRFQSLRARFFLLGSRRKHVPNLSGAL
jgi:hypothetical protein